MVIEWSCTDTNPRFTIGDTAGWAIRSGTCWGVDTIFSETEICSIEGREGIGLVGAWGRGMGLGFGLVIDVKAVRVTSGALRIAIDVVPATTADE